MNPKMTPKQFSRSIAEAPLTTTRTTRALVAVYRDEILQSLADGWPTRAIWERMKRDGLLSVGYDAFRRAAARLAGAPRTQPQASTSPAATGFNFNPTPNPKELF